MYDTGPNYAALWKDAKRKKRRDRLVAGPLGWFIEGGGFFVLVMVLTVIALALWWFIGGHPVFK